MIWLLLLICIYGTIFCIEQLVSALGTHIGCTTIHQTIMLLANQDNVDKNKLARFADERDELIEIRLKQLQRFTIISIVLSALWTLFFYLWH